MVDKDKHDVVIVWVSQLCDIYHIIENWIKITILRRNTYLVYHLAKIKKNNDI